MARLREIEVQKREGEILEAADVAREWADVLRLVRAGVLAIHGRVRAELPHLGAADLAVIDREARAVLEALADDRMPG